VRRFSTSPIGSRVIGSKVTALDCQWRTERTLVPACKGREGRLTPKGAAALLVFGVRRLCDSPTLLFYRRSTRGGAGHRRWTVRDVAGRVLREWVEPSGSSPVWERDWIYRGQILLATIDATTTRHLTLDHLGTPRLVTDQSGVKLAFKAYWPYGRGSDGSESGRAEQEVHRARARRLRHQLDGGRPRLHACEVCESDDWEIRKHRPASRRSFWPEIVKSFRICRGKSPSVRRS